MSTTARKQDLPPQGGYKPITFARIPAKSYFGGGSLILTHLAITAGSLYLYALGYKRIERERIEKRSSMLAIMPLLQAERDREYLKQLRRNRDEEAKLMANVEGWEVGTYYGQPVYKTYDNDKLINPSPTEYFVHSSERDYKKFKDLIYWI
ncbi:hypothetical protein AAG570_006790 [Ranatra chinensis]|uniref:NADH dehydrogenase [ubiquinone] 1 alpha subcomplex subunit 13 n=1 Tax=Ranatra chinensis TaxID=642074 RepID=A0ABD0ZC21_9HEMI